MMALSFRRRPWFSFLLMLLPLCSFKAEADDLKNAWDIQGPTSKKCVVTAPTESDTDGSTTVCDDSSSAIRLEYTIHKDAKYPKYQIFQMGECKEVFDIGTEPVLSPGEDNKVALSLSPAVPSDGGDDTATATLEIIPNKDAFASPWWRRLSFTEQNQHTIEFCIRMGLYTPPQAGDMEVNFRETNVVVTFNKTLASDSNGDDDKSEESDVTDESSEYEYIVDSFTVTKKELMGITIVLAGMGGVQEEENEEIDEDSSSSSDNKNNDEL